MRVLPRWALKWIAVTTAAGLAAATAISARADAPLVLGVLPNLTARQIVETYRPLADFLETRLGQRVTLVSARDFKTFVERTRQGEYDLVLTAPHLAWLAVEEGAYHPLLKYAQPARGLLVVRADAPLERVASLRGRTIATGDSLAVAVLALQAQLAAEGLRLERDYQARDAGTHFNAVMQVVNGRADAAMLGLHPYNLLPVELRRQLRVLAETPPLASLMYLAHPDLPPAKQGAVRDALFAFATTPDGRAFLERGGYRGFAPVDGNELRALRPYALQARERLLTKP